MTRALWLAVLVALGCSRAAVTEPDVKPIGPGCELGAHVPAAGGFPAYTVWAHYPLCPAPAGTTTYEGKTVHWDGTP